MACYFFVMTTAAISGLKRLSPSEKLFLVGALWDEIAAGSPDEIQLTAKQKRELDRRLADFRRDPGEGSTWPEVKKRILRRP
jgi:putative addiction module component (TIGR02574 family)